MTIAIWKSEEHLAAAKDLVQAEYKKIGFDSAGFMQSLEVKMEREIYRTYPK